MEYILNHMCSLTLIPLKEMLLHLIIQPLKQGGQLGGPNKNMVVNRLCSCSFI